MKLVIVGGVAGGMSAAARARRLNEAAEIIVLDRGPHVSFANCGLPYHLSGEIPERQSLLLHTPRTLKSQLNLDVRVNSEVTAIDRTARTVTVSGPQGEYTLDYDALILAPGAKAMVPPIRGVDNPAVFPLRTIPELDAIMAHLAGLEEGHGRGEHLDEGAPLRAVVVGAGFIGLEAVEALAHRGLEVTLVEFAPHVLPPLDDELAPLLQAELERNGVTVRVGTSVVAIDDAATHGGVVATLSDGTTVSADLVIVATGVVPDTALAKRAGLELGLRDSIVVDSVMRTSDPHIWAVGDAVQVRQRVGGADLLAPVPLAAPANRHGRLAADAIMRGRTGGSQPPAVLGTAIVRVFSLVAAITGASQRTLRTGGVESVTVHIHPGSHAGYYPGSEQIHLIGSFAPDGTLLGAQAVGRDGVDKRIDVLATAIRAGMTADDLADLDLAYAPPFGSAKDPVNMLAFTAQNILDGTMPVWYAQDLQWAKQNALILDVRSAGECARGKVFEALNVPHTQVRNRIDEIRAAAAGRPIAVHCASGVRSYLATRILREHGLDARNLSGGALTLQAVNPRWAD